MHYILTLCTSEVDDFWSPYIFLQLLERRLSITIRFDAIHDQRCAFSFDFFETGNVVQCTTFWNVKWLEYVLYLWHFWEIDKTRSSCIKKNIIASLHNIVGINSRCSETSYVKKQIFIFFLDKKMQLCNCFKKYHTKQK